MGKSVTGLLPKFNLTETCCGEGEDGYLGGWGGGVYCFGTCAKCCSRGCYVVDEEHVIDSVESLRNDGENSGGIFETSGCVFGCLGGVGACAQDVDYRDGGFGGYSACNVEALVVAALDDFARTQWHGGYGVDAGEESEGEEFGGVFAGELACDGWVAVVFCLMD